MSVQITSDNLSKFNKRLHKALKETFGDSVSLSQSAEMVARAAGFKTLHDLQTHLAPKTLPVAVTPLPQISDNPSTTWIERINADIRHYAATHPTSVVQHWRWRENEGTHSLDIVGDHASFKLVFGEDVMSYVDTKLSDDTTANCCTASPKLGTVSYFENCPSAVVYLGDRAML